MKRGGEDVLWMLWTANLIKCVDQGVLVLGLECYVEIDGGVSGWVTQVEPVLWDRIP